MSFVSAAVAVSAIGSIRENEARRRAGLPPRTREPRAPAPRTTETTDHTTAMVIGGVAGYAIGQSMSASTDSTDSCKASAFSSGGGGDFGGGGADGNW